MLRFIHDEVGYWTIHLIELLTSRQIRVMFEISLLHYYWDVIYDYFVNGINGVSVWNSVI